MNRAPNVSSPALRGLGASRMPLLPRRLNARAASGQPVRRRRELVVIREAASTGVKENAVDATENGTATGNANNGSSANGNGAGTAVDSGRVAASSVNGNGNGVISERVASQNGVSSSNGASVVIGEIDVAASAGAGVEHPAMDPCDAGQLEACAATRNGAAVLSNGAAVRTDTVRSTGAENGASGKAQASIGGVNATATAGSASPKTNSTAGTPYDSPGGRWSQVKGYSVWRRTLQIWIFALTFAFKYWRMAQKAKKLSDEEASKKKRELAVWLRLGLVRLGPTFIKIGQQFSTRVDVLSQEFVKELELLQDRVPAFDSKTARSIVKQSCGRSVDEIFDEFEDEPIAAASLGQVHLAKLKGQKVVVKVQRPGLKELFDIDLKNIRVLAQWLQAVDPKRDGAARDWVAIYDECSRILYEEIDYRMEAENANRFRKNFASTSWVKVPEVYMEYTTGETLVMEYCPGVKVNNAEAIDKMGLDRKLLARLAVESYLQQILRYGFFHADPHPGNVAVDAVDGGRLIYYDFGMMGSIRTDVRQGLLELFYAIYQRDSDRCLDALVQMGVLVPGGDRTAIRRTADFFLKSFEERLDTQQQERAQDPASQKEFKPQRSKDEAKARRKQILSAIGEDLLVTASDQPFRFPAAFTFVVRSFTVLDGIGKSLDPRFDISEIAAPYARELLLEARPQMSKIRSDIVARFTNQNRAVANLFKGPNQIEYIGETVQRLERGDLKLRVRTLEAERALARMALYQQFLAGLVVACTLTNVATLMQTMGNALAAKLNFAAAGVVGIFCLGKLFTVKKEEEKEAVLSGTVA